MERGGNSENVDSELVVVVLFLILKDRVIRERVRNLEQRKEKRRKREREARWGTTKARGTKYVHTRCGRSSGFVATNRSNHLSMQPSLAIRFTDTELPRFRYTLQLPSAMRCVLFIRRDRVGPVGTRERGLQRSDLSSRFHSSLRSNRGVKFVINCQVSGAGWAARLKTLREIRKLLLPRPIWLIESSKDSQKRIDQPGCDKFTLWDPDFCSSLHV